MITITEVERLANLSRIKLDQSEKESLTKEIDSILAYVDQIKKATLDIDFSPMVGAVHNVFRSDTIESTNDKDRQGILDEVPHKEGDFVAVKKIIEQD